MVPHHLLWRGPVVVATNFMITALAPNEIFVFGSNLAGRHGAGAAFYAKQHFGALQGIGFGPTGQCFAIPTKDKHLQTLPIESIRLDVMFFFDYAYDMPHLRFLVTEIGCGLAGYTPADIAPLFRDAPANVILPDSFKAILNTP